MTITFPCTKCGKQYRATPELCGKQIKCKDCGTLVRVPTPRGVGGASAQPAAATRPRVPGRPPRDEEPVFHTEDPSESAPSIFSDDDIAGTSPPPAPEPARSSPKSRRKRASFGASSKVAAIIGSVGVGAVVILVVAFRVGKPWINRTVRSGLKEVAAAAAGAGANPVSGSPSNSTSPNQAALYLPANWDIAIKVRVAELADGRLDRLPVLKQAFLEPVNQAREGDLDLKTVDELFIALDEATRDGVAIISCNKDVALDPGQEEKYNGQTIVRRAGNEVEYQVRPHSKMIVVARTREQLIKLIDQGARSESHPINFPQGCHIAICVRNGAGANNRAVPSFRPGSVPSSAGQRSDEVRAMTVGIKIASRVEAEMFVQARDAATAQNLQREWEADRRSQLEFADAVKELGTRPPASVDVSLHNAYKDATCTVTGNQLRFKIALEYEAMIALAANQSLGGWGGVTPGLPSFAGTSATDPVTVRISGVDADSFTRITQRLRTLADNGVGVCNGRSDNTSGVAVVQVSPVSDPTAFSKRIDFGRVTEVKGRLVTVQADAALVAKLPTMIPDVPSLARRKAVTPEEHQKFVLEDIEPTNSIFVRREALEELAKLKPGGQRAEVAAKLILLLGESDPFLVDNVLDALRTWGDETCVPAVARLLRSDSRPSTRAKSLALLGKYPGEKSAEGVALCLTATDKSTADSAAAILDEMEPAVAQKAVAKALLSVESFDRQKLLKVLKKLCISEPPTKETVDILLDVLRTESNPFALQEAIPIVAKVKEERVAVMLATGLGEFRYRKDVIPVLIEMGDVAEKPVLEYLKHNDSDARIAACEVLARIGTRRSLASLQPLVRDFFMGRAAKQAIDAIELRLKSKK
jgi:HEAT repeat protein